jgi:soluble lytic murein transglycosylase-like protein
MVGANAWASTIRAAAKRNGVPEEILNGIIRTESGYDPRAVVAKTGAVGIAQILPSTGKDLGIVPGQNAAVDIDAAARYMKQLHDQAISSGYATGGIMPWVVATSAYHAGMGNVRSGNNIGPESLAYPGKVMQGLPGFEEAAAGFRPGVGGGGVTNDVQIDQITVNTQATDADGIAGAIGNATQRKLLAAQAEGGIQ